MNNQTPRRRRRLRDRCASIQSCSSPDDSLISSLPDCLLIEILSLLPFNEAVRTSALSLRWRYLWKHINRLNLSIVGDSCQLVRQLSCLYVTKLESLRIKFEKRRNANHGETEKLVVFGIEKGVQNLSLLGGYHTIPDNVFSIPTLKRLELDVCCGIINYVTCFCLPCLQTIVLQGIVMDRNWLSLLISNSPALQSLTVLHLSLDRLKISGSATLKRLKIQCKWRLLPEDGIDISDLPRLEYLELIGPRYLGLLSSFNNLPSLGEVCLRFHLADGDDKINIDWSKIISMFPQAKVLTMHNLDYRSNRNTLLRH